MRTIIKFCLSLFDYLTEKKIILVNEKKFCFYFNN